MRILFVTSHLHLPQLYGGLQNSTHQLCLSLQQRGHQVSLLCGLAGNGVFGWTSRLKLHANNTRHHHKITRDTLKGYPIWRTWHVWEEVAYVIGQEKPDVVVIKSGDIVKVAEAVKPTGVPIAVQLHDVEFHLHNGDFQDIDSTTYIANSSFTAQKYHEMYGIKSYVVHPFISKEKYKTESTRENITFINPHPQKGVDIALDVAKHCPEIPFTFVEGWPLKPEDRHKLFHDLAALPNVSLHPVVQDMKQVYGKCRVLLAPSRWEEAYGRVISEAQFSGIPAVASNRGGLPESVGEAGILLDPDAPVQEWVRAVKRLWHDDVYYDTFRARAYRHSARPELNQEIQLKMIEDIFASAVNYYEPEYILNTGS